MNATRKFTKLSVILIISLVLVLPTLVRAVGEIDPSFVASAVRTNASNYENACIKTAKVQPDGKILIGGSFAAVGKYAIKGIARLNSDGTVDTTFNPPELDKSVFFPLLTVDATVTGIGLQADGKILVGGDFSRVNGVFEAVLIRLNADGSPDVAFNTSLHQNLTQWQGTIYDIEVLPNGKIYLGGDDVSYLTQNFGRIVRPISRLNSDGTFDDSFGDSNLNYGMTVRKIVPLTDGTLLVGGGGSQGGLARLTANGFFDSSYNRVLVTTSLPNTSATVDDFLVLPNGQVLMVGEFSFVNGFSHGRIARINSDGLIDLSFNTNNNGANGRITSIAMEVTGKMLIGGSFLTYNSTAKAFIARLNTDGTLDLSLTYTTATANSNINVLESISGARIFVGGQDGTWDRIQILNADGTFPGPIDNLVGKTGWVNAIAQQTDGKVLAGGRFVTASGAKRNNLARYNVDGTIDTTFNPFVGSDPSFIVNKIIVQPDGKILIGTQYAGLSRLNQDGSRDLTFTQLITTSSNITDVLLMSNGQILVFGSFVLSGSERKIARLEANGTISAIFPTNFGVNTNHVNRAALQPDGKILIGGDFTQVDGVNRGRIARINANGTHDTTFNPPGGANGIVNDLALQTDGKVVLVGEFDALNGSTTRKYVGRLNSDGTLDTSFSQAADALLHSVELQSDGKVLIGGIMYNVGGLPRKGLARLNPNGSVDTTFLVGSGLNNPVWAIAIQSDQKILLGGEFSRYDNNSRVSIARLLNKPVANSVLYDFDGDGRSDSYLFRPSTNTWYGINSGSSTITAVTFGAAGDVSTPADFDGDGKCDIAIFRPSSGDWWYRSSLNGLQYTAHLGQSGDIPLASDYDGDGKADFAIYRNGSWYVYQTSDGQTRSDTLGNSTDRPVIGDFDGDRKTDLAVYRPSTRTWWYKSSVNSGQYAVQFGLAADKPVPADYDGDGKTDIAVWRPSDGAWYVFQSSNAQTYGIYFGLTGDRPSPGDYDGDGKADVAVWRPSDGVWYLLTSSSGFTGYRFGLSGDVPAENAFIQ